MTREDAILKVIHDEIAAGQAAWEMLQDGYNGDIDAYIADYKDDYTAEQTEDGWLVKHIAGKEWTV